MLAGLLCSLYLILFILGVGSNLSALIRTIRVYRLVRKFEWSTDSRQSRGSNVRIRHVLWFSFTLIITNLSLLLCLCFLISDVLSQGWHLGSLVCWYYWWSENVAKTFVAFLLSVLIVERCLFSVTKSTWKSFTSSPVNVPILVFSGLLLVIILAAPLQPYVGVQILTIGPPSVESYTVNLTKCGISDDMPKLSLRYHVIGSFLFAYVFPMVVWVVCYVLIKRKSKKLIRLASSGATTETHADHPRIPASFSSTSTVSTVNVDRVENVSKRITMIITCLIILFIICWSPYWLTTLVVQFDNGDHVSGFNLPFTIFVCHVLPYVNATVAGLLFMALAKRVKLFKMYDMMNGTGGPAGPDEGRDEKAYYHEMATRDTFEHSSSSLNS